MAEVPRFPSKLGLCKECKADQLVPTTVAGRQAQHLQDVCTIITSNSALQGVSLDGPNNIQFLASRQLLAFFSKFFDYELSNAAVQKVTQVFTIAEITEPELRTFIAWISIGPAALSRFYGKQIAYAKAVGRNNQYANEAGKLLARLWAIGYMMDCPRFCNDVMLALGGWFLDHSLTTTMAETAYQTKAPTVFKRFIRDIIRSDGPFHNFTCPPLIPAWKKLILKGGPLVLDITALGGLNGYMDQKPYWLKYIDKYMCDEPQISAKDWLNRRGLLTN